MRALWRIDLTLVLKGSAMAFMVKLLVNYRETSKLQGFLPLGRPDCIPEYFYWYEGCAFGNSEDGGLMSKYFWVYDALEVYELCLVR